MIVKYQDYDIENYRADITLLGPGPGNPGLLSSYRQMIRSDGLFCYVQAADASDKLLLIDRNIIMVQIGCMPLKGKAFWGYWSSDDLRVAAQTNTLFQ